MFAREMEQRDQSVAPHRILSHKFLEIRLTRWNSYGVKRVLVARPKDWPPLPRRHDPDTVQDDPHTRRNGADPDLITPPCLIAHCIHTCALKSCPLRTAGARCGA